MDARVRELQFLAEVERLGSLDLRETHKLDQHLRSMIAHLINEGYLNGVGIHSMGYQSDWEKGRRELEGRIEYDRWRSHFNLMSGQEVTLRMTHKGRVRLSELEQALQTSRDRDPTGLMLSKRHLDRDLAIGILSARPETPLSVAFLDMNGLKTINDRHGHDAGDKAIIRYLQALSMICGDGAEGYRGDGGDEVVLILRATPKSAAAALLDAVLLKLAAEKVDGLTVSLTASCGIATTDNPNEDGGALKQRADESQYRAKEVAHQTEPRPSVIAVEGGEPQIVAVQSATR